MKRENVTSSSSARAINVDNFSRRTKYTSLFSVLEVSFVRLKLYSAFVNRLLKIQLWLPLSICRKLACEQTFNGI